MILSHATHESRTDGRLEGRQAGGVTAQEKWTETLPQSRERGWFFGERAWWQTTPPPQTAAACAWTTDSQGAGPGSIPPTAARAPSPKHPLPIRLSRAAASQRGEIPGPPQAAATVSAAPSCPHGLEPPPPRQKGTGGRPGRSPGLRVGQAVTF